MGLELGRGLSRSLQSHLHWRQRDTRLPAQLQAHLDPLAICGVGVFVEIALKDPKQELRKSVFNSKKARRFTVPA